MRIGNAAAGQFQLDVYGEVMDATAPGRAAAASTTTTDGVGPAAARSWSSSRTDWAEPGRGHLGGARAAPPLHPLQGDGLGGGRPGGQGRRAATGSTARSSAGGELRDEIHDEVLRAGLRRRDATRSPSPTAPKQLDASAADDPAGRASCRPTTRGCVGTVAAIERELLVDGFVLRYQTRRRRGVDGLPAGEGAFLACTFWLADNLRAARPARRGASELFERLLALRNDVGLLSEEYDPVARRLVGNFPQAFSHVGLVNTARNLERMGRRHGLGQGTRARSLGAPSPRPPDPGGSRRAGPGLPAGGRHLGDGGGHLARPLVGQQVSGARQLDQHRPGDGGRQPPAARGRDDPVGLAHQHDDRYPDTGQAGSQPAELVDQGPLLDHEAAP